MEQIYALTVGFLVAIGVYLLLSRHLLKIVFGLMIISNAANLLIFTSGRITGSHPPFVSDTMKAEIVDISNPLPQALILTAIVIGFGLLAFALALVLRTYRDLSSLDEETLTREVE